MTRSYDILGSYDGPKQEAADNCVEHRLSGLSNESGMYHGQIMNWLRELKPFSWVLLAGEERDVGTVMATELDAGVETVGLVKADHVWDFNHARPKTLYMGTYDVVVSQAILEHILNPYGFLRNLAELAMIGGHVIIHTHVPGYPYHRFPVDCLRYFPDWFDAVAPVLDLEVVKMTQDGGHLFVKYKRTAT